MANNGLFKNLFGGKKPVKQAAPAPEKPAPASGDSSKLTPSSAGVDSEQAAKRLRGFKGLK